MSSKDTNQLFRVEFVCEACKAKACADGAAPCAERQRDSDHAVEISAITYLRSAGGKERRFLRPENSKVA